MNSITLQSLVSGAVHQTITCDVPFHYHKSPVLELYALEYFGHHISIVQDQDKFDIQIDRIKETEKYGLAWEEVENYIKSFLEGKQGDIQLSLPPM